MAGERVIAYFDGFNVYRCLKRQVARDGKPVRWKWYDPAALTRKIVPSATDVQVKFFTSQLRPTSGHKELSRQRQLFYLQALRSRSDITVHLGQYKERQARRPLVRDPGADPEGLDLLRRANQKPRRIRTGRVTVDVWEMNEKGSDVNLATHLVADAFRGDVDHAVVFSNDTDLCGPIELITNELRLPVTVVNPEGQKSAAELFRVATTPRQLRVKAVVQSQLPKQLYGTAGKINRPKEW